MGAGGGLEKRDFLSLSVASWTCNMLLGCCWCPCLLMWDEEEGATCWCRREAKQILGEMERRAGETGLPRFPTASSFLLVVSA